MNAFCPIMSFQSMHSGGVYCLGKNCGFADAAGECLIKQALQCYVSKERTAAAEKEQEIRAISHNLDHISRTPNPLDFNTYRIEPSSQWVISNDFVGWGGLQEGP